MKDNEESTESMGNCISREECKVCKELYDQKIDAVDDRLKKVESSVEQIHTLATSVAKMATSLEQMAKQLEKQGEKLDAIEAEPAEKWKNAVWLVIAGLIGAALTMMLSGMGL